MTVHPRDEINRLCSKKKTKEEGSPALRIALMHQHKDYIKKTQERLISAANKGI